MRGGGTGEGGWHIQRAFRPPGPSPSHSLGVGMTSTRARSRRAIALHVFELMLHVHDQHDESDQHEDADDASDPDGSHADHLSAFRVAHSIAYRIGRASAIPRPAMSNAVP